MISGLQGSTKEVITVIPIQEDHGTLILKTEHEELFLVPGSEEEN